MRRPDLAGPRGSRPDARLTLFRGGVRCASLLFGGHFSTRTRAYSTTLGALRAARAAWHHRRHTPPPSPTTIVLAHWAYREPASPPTSNASPPSSAAARHANRR
ncbi:replication initiator [Streptomyces sp. NPDC047821]|uniref:replication initiator n=1 Tax=Streptomyces sp. NPDC047821 TaxID=3365488 RepID=UPI003718FAC8